MKPQALMALFLIGAASATAQTYDPPNPSRRVPNVTVTRTDSGATTHIKVTFTVPPSSETMPTYNEAFFYGWIEADGKRLMVTQTKGADSPHGFLAKRQTFAPGDRVTLETDLPRSFVDTIGAHLHAGIGAIGVGFYPTPNLLVQK